MVEWAPWLGMVLAFATFGLMAWAGLRLLTDGVRVYERRVVVRLGRDLRNVFIQMSPARLVWFSTAGVTLAAVVGGLLAGVVGAVAAAGGAAIGPPMLLHRFKRKRTRLFVRQLPDCLNAMSSSLRGGSNLARAMDLAAAQQPAPISQELSVVLSEYRLGRELHEALGEMAVRVRCQEVTLVNAAINIARTVGGNLADTFDNLADTLREKAQVEGKIEALTAMGKMQGWVISLLPFLLGAVLYRQEPEGMRALIFEPVGWATLAVLAVLIVVAALMIHRIVSIDV